MSAATAKAIKGKPRAAAALWVCHQIPQAQIDTKVQQAVVCIANIVQEEIVYSNDPRGRRAPFGCHIRRMNPRDTKLTRLTDVNLHRIIRRGTTFGPPYDPNALSEADDQVPRGAYFLFISAKAMATIEFLQQEWINDGDFMGLGGERDPIVGLQNEEATFTIPKEPVRRRVHGIETFNVLRGGEYFFMPSMSALNWLATLP